MKKNKYLQLSCTLEINLKNFIKKGTEQNIEFAFWNKSLTELYQILTDLTRFHSEGDWLFHASALQCAFPLFFCSFQDGDLFIIKTV